MVNETEPLKDYKNHLDEEQKEIVERFQSKYTSKPGPLETGWIISQAFYNWMAPLFKVPFIKKKIFLKS